jgi:hypothetical protein
MNQGYAGVSTGAEKFAGKMQVAQERWDATPFDFERQHQARSLISEISDTAEGLTKAGPLAGAVNMATASGGYEAVVGDQEQMRQSSDQLQMVKMIVAELKREDPQHAATYDTALKNYGYQFGQVDLNNLLGRR